MDVVFVIFMLLVAVVVAGWVISVLARRHVLVATSLSPEHAAQVCDSKFSRLGWRRVDGRGDLNYQARGIGSRGRTPPVLSISIGTDESGVTGVELWMSEWTGQYGMVNHIEKVFWKRWTLPRALREAEAGAAIGGVSVAAPTAVGHQQTPVNFAGGQSGPTGGGGQRKAAADDPDVILPDPGRPENDLTQLGYQMFTACGLTVLSWGGVSLEQHMQLLVERAPVFGGTVVNPAGAGSLRGRDDGLWVGFEGPRGSVIAYFAIHRGDGGDFSDFVLNNVMNPVAELPHPLKWGIGTVGAKVPAGVAQILASALAVPLWELPPFTGQRPADQSLDLPKNLELGLIALGWQRIGDNGFRYDVALNRGGTQAVFFSPYNADSFAVVAPLDNSTNGAIPEALSGRSFGRYTLEGIADMVVLSERFAAGPPAPDPHAITAAGQAITLYAEQQFAGPPSGRPPTSMASPVTPLHYPAYPEATPRPTGPPALHAYPPSSPQSEWAPHLTAQYPMRSAPTEPPNPAYPVFPADNAFPPITPPGQHNYPTLPPHSQRTASATRQSSADRPAGALTGNRGVVVAAAAVAAVAVVGLIAVFSSPDGNESSSPTTSVAVKPDNDSVVTDSDRGAWPTTRTGSAPPRRPATEVALDVSAPITQPECNGTGIVVLGSAVTPGRYDAEIQRFLDAHPGASYLRTDRACPSLRQATDAGNPIYAVYRPAGTTLDEVCAAVRAAGGDAYGKWLDETTDPNVMIRC
jgi:hypothetical protein